MNGYICIMNLKNHLSKFRTRRIIAKSREHYRKIPKVLWATLIEFLDDKALKMGASLSYFTLISLAPILVILIAVIGFIYGQEAAKGEIVNQISEFIGEYPAQVIQSLILSAAAPDTGFIATLIGVGVLFFSSLAVFVELKESLNIIWGIEPIPGRGLKNIFYYRLKSFLIVGIIAALLLVSTILSTISVVVSNFATKHFPDFVNYLALINAFTSIVMITVLFACIFKFLPDVKVKWKYVWFGAFITSGLFYIGKYLITTYLQYATFSSTYGAAGSLVVFLVWINYSSLILFFGAELTQVTRKYYSKTELEPKNGFVKIKKVSTLVADSVEKLKNSNNDK
ncbi:MAG: YihY/virulence factor BrkB family protein [Chlorobi bacterium CHB7]|nr:YihY/virulence factor BrkB family protein [Chlorobi bacterium CHB7]OQY76937.1 MAG: hypothetical protein B6D43_08510 [Ignavibacteriales bacterium UTCHB1]RIK49392.1 MAG: hypothetical protein DCC60_03580 [Ignavibacteriota bacterium]